MKASKNKATPRPGRTIRSYPVDLRHRIKLAAWKEELKSMEILEIAMLEYGLKHVKEVVAEIKKTSG